MSNMLLTSPDSPEVEKRKKHNTNWHEAANCAIQIELRDYKNILEFLPEYILGRNYYRIDLLVIKKMGHYTIAKNIAKFFKTYNLIEVKGIGCSVNTDVYYKTIGYAGLFIKQTGKANQYSALDITLTFLCMHYPRKLMKHLHENRHLKVKQTSPGIYRIIKETFDTQIIVTQELPPENNLYLRCLTNNLQDIDLINQLSEDYINHQNQTVYMKYLNQLSNANSKTKGETSMVCEGVLNLCGTSSEEIIARTRKEEADYYLPQIQNLSSQINYLKELLKQNNIAFDSELKVGSN